MNLIIAIIGISILSILLLGSGLYVARRSIKRKREKKLIEAARGKISMTYKEDTWEELTLEKRPQIAYRPTPIAPTKEEIVASSEQVSIYARGEQEEKIEAKVVMRRFD